MNFHTKNHYNTIITESDNTGQTAIADKAQGARPQQIKTIHIHATSNKMRGKGKVSL